MWVHCQLQLMEHTEARCCREHRWLARKGSNPQPLEAACHNKLPAQPHGCWASAAFSAQAGHVCNSMCVSVRPCLCRKVMRLAAVLSDAPLVQRLMRAVQQTAGTVAPAAVCSELQAICLTLAGCVRLASALRVPAAEALRIAHIAPALAGPCLDALEAAASQLTAAPAAAQGARIACLTVANLANSMQDVCTLVCARCGSGAMASVIDMLTPMRLARFLHVAGSLLQGNWECFNRECVPLLCDPTCCVTPRIV